MLIHAILSLHDTDLNTNFEIEDEEAISAEIAEVMAAKIKQIQQRQIQAEQQTRRVAEWSAIEWKSNEIVRRIVKSRVG